jgi:formate dehydrogenase major subunit
MADSAPIARVSFELDGRQVEAFEMETIFDVAQREGIAIPHLCHSGAPGYRPDGNCRTCMVEIDGERTLAASCIRRPTEGMVVTTTSARADQARRMVFELLVADHPSRAQSPDPQSRFWQMAELAGQTDSRLPRLRSVLPDTSHPAMRVNLNACINCTLCVRACREVQVNDVIGMAMRGHDTKVVFDFDDPMGQSTCVACGECVQACPTGALIEASLVDAAGIRTVYPDKSVDTLCPYCGVGCQTSVHVKANRIVAIDGRDGPANEGRLCVKGRFGFDYITHPGRLTRPLVRRDGVAKDAGIEIAPGEIGAYFREASWEEALDRAARGFDDIRQALGGGGLAGFGSAKGSNEEAYLFQKLVRVAFGTNNVDHCTRLCHASSVAALMEGVGSGAVSAPFTAANDADVIIVIGARPNVNHPVAATFFKQAAKRGARLVLMDPRGNEMSRYAWRTLPFTPGRDVAMLNAMIHTIIEEGLVDTQYVQAMADGFDELCERVKPYTPEKMAQVCGIDAETLREVARAYATAERSIIFWGMGVSQHTHGTDNARCLIALALLTGQIGRPGTGLHPLRGQNNVQGASDAGLIPMVYPDYRSVVDGQVRAEMMSFWGAELDPDTGLTVVEIMQAVLGGQIQGLYVMGENPAMSDPDQNHTRQALASLRHLVVQDLFLTETAWHADVVLPASAKAEKWGTFTNTNRQVQLARPAVSLPGDARQDLWIVQEIGRRLGLEWSYEHPRDVFVEMAQVMPSLENITWERLEREGSVTYPCASPDGPGTEIVFGSGFPTASGRARIVPADLVPPAELPDDDYPYILTTGRILEHWHTGAMTRRAEFLDAIEPEAVVAMNRADIDALALTAGAAVTVRTRRGEIALRVREDAQVPQGVVFIPFCFAEAAANFLTNPQLDPDGKIPEFKFCAATVMPHHAQEKRDPERPSVP